jgi:hypothetical protein
MYPIPMTLVALREPTQAPLQPTQTGKEVDKGGESNKKGGIDTPKQAMATHSMESSPIPPCSIFDIYGHASFNCPRLPNLKELYNTDDLENDPSILVVEFTFPDSSTKHVHSLHINHPCF